MNRPEDIIDRSLDGQLSGEEWAALQKAVIEDPEVRRQYVEQRWLHAELTGNRELLAEASVVPESPARTNRGLIWLNAAAIAALLGLVALLFSNPRESETVATLVAAQDCRWAGSELPTNEGAKLGAGTLALMEGMATIQFHSGATVTLEAPSVLEVESAMRCRLVEGSVVADVPESAHGFTIDTEKMEVIDLGTRFGVTTSPIGGSHVFVFEGEVKVHEDDADTAQHLLTGKSLHRGGMPSAPDQEVTRVSQPEPKEGNWTAISTAVGRGKDAYIRNGDAHGPTGAQPVVMVKSTDLAPSNIRRGFLTFDLSGMSVDRVETAKLSLKVEASGLGFASLVPDSRFALYGVLDPAIDEWGEDRLTWKDAPASLVSDSIDPERFVRLAEFEIRKGSSHGLIDISSSALSEFIAGHGDSLATFMLVRETGEFDQQGLVHAFASKEHPAGPAPTLWIKTATEK